ncbi:hypothetical protein CBW53_05975 [Yersinia frederiksenii]|nr:hypothetical protein CBW53_05975 [Yersinia frederiksenii]CNI28683.1 Uncharacterised protein [Yersinia frederiksenii]
MVIVNFTTEDKEVISQYFSSPQSPEWYKFLGEVELSDPRWSEFYFKVNEEDRSELPTPE